MRVGIFTESYQPLINGVSTSVRTLMAELERAGHTVFVFTSRFPDYQDDRPGVFRFPSINSLVEPDYVLPVPISPQIMGSIPALKLDIVHSQSPFFLGLMARRVARKYRIPHVSTNHTLYTEYAHYLPILPSAMTRTMLVNWMRDYYNSCDRVLAPSEMTRQRLIAGYGVRTPVDVIPTGIPAPPYLLTSSEETLKELGLPKRSRVLLYVGRLAPEKNLEMLLQAFALMTLRAQNIYLVLAGSGKSERPLQKLAAKLGIAERTIFTGFLPRTKLDPLYQTAELFLFPSKTETQGLAIGEALAAGTPCVVVNQGGAPESIRDGIDGFLVTDDPAHMAERALRLLGDRALHKKMAQHAREHGVDLTPEKVAAKIIAIYEDLIHTSQTGKEPGRPNADAVGTRPGYEAPRDT